MMKSNDKSKEHEDEEHEETIIEKKRVSWKKYLKSISLKLLVLLIIILLLFVTFIFSDPTLVQQTDINIQDFLLIIISSSLLFILVLLSFSWLLFSQEKDKFGIETIISRKSLVLFLLSLLFITNIYLLLDVALKTDYLEIGPVIVYVFVENLVNSILGLDFSFYDTNTPFIQNYTSIRNFFFIVVFLILLMVPLLTLLIILTREGRHTLFNKISNITKEEANIFRTIITVIFGIPILLLLFSILMELESKLIFGIILSIVFAYWLIQLLRLVWLGTKLVTFFTYSNLLIIIPIIGAFYVAPVILWSIWDIFELYRDNPETSLDLGFIISELLLRLLVNLTYWKRILEFDFMIIIGIAALIIGFAEGYSIIAIFGALKRGATFAISGEVVSTAPKAISIIQFLIPLTSWVILLWDKMSWITQMITLEINIDLPFELPKFFVYITSWLNSIVDTFPHLIFLSFLVIPLYIIFTSSLKFFSVKLATEGLNDQQYFFLLISSAYTLIVTQILTDIQALSIAVGSPAPPTVPFMTGTFINTEILLWAIKIVMYIEAFAFYAGFTYLFYKLVQNYLENRKELSSEPFSN